MSDDGFSNEEMLLLDIISNLEPLSQHELSGFVIQKNRSFTSELLEEILQKLSAKNLIDIQKNEYTTAISIKPDKQGQVISMLTQYLGDRKIGKERLSEEVDRNLIGFFRLLESKWISDNKPRFGFSDYYWDNQSLDLCEKLTEIGMLFKHLSSSKKHDYQTYYFRRKPLDFEKILEELVLSRINLEGLEIATDWRIIALAMFSETSLKLEDVKLNFPNLTIDEINEILSVLENRGIISRERGDIKIIKGMKDIIKNYFFLNAYQPFKSFLAEQLKGRVKKSISNLYTIGLIKRILASSENQKITEPFYIIKRNSLKNISEEELKEAVKLGVIFLTGSDILIAHEVISEVESGLRSAVTEESLVIIPPNEVHTAIVTWRRVFGEECEEYIKIYDEYVNEETLEILYSYSRPKIKITILSSIMGARSTDKDEMKGWVEKIKNSGRDIELYFIGYEKGKTAPFHFRYIISKDICYEISTSVMQVGKTKEAHVRRIPVSQKKVIETAFDFWIYVPMDKLKEKEISRMNFDEWLKSKPN